MSAQRLRNLNVFCLQNSRVLDFFVAAQDFKHAWAEDCRQIAGNFVQDDEIAFSMLHNTGQMTRQHQSSAYR